MILRRFMQHVKEQNWFAVGLDVIVVIVGIFLGLQVQNWYEEKQERAEEMVYVERMLADADASLQDFREELAIIDQQKQNREKFNTILTNNSFTEDGLASAADYYSGGYIGWLNFDYVEDTLDELISTGKLTIIRSSEFKNKIARFRSEIASHKTGYNIYVELLVQNTFARARLLRRELTSGRIISTPDQLNNNQELYDRIRVANSSLDAIYRSNLDILELSKEFREEIVAELERLQ